MKKSYHSLHSFRNASPVAVLFFILFMTSCRQNDPFIGRWTVERVHVEFDETKATPEMVRQYGELEKGNILEINEDSVLTFVSGGDTLQGHCSLQKQNLYFEGNLFGRYANDIIETQTATPLGKVIVNYRKDTN